MLKALAEQDDRPMAGSCVIWSSRNTSVASGRKSSRKPSRRCGMSIYEMAARLYEHLVHGDWTKDEASSYVDSLMHGDRIDCEWHCARHGTFTASSRMGCRSGMLNCSSRTRWRHEEPTPLLLRRLQAHNARGPWRAAPIQGTRGSQLVGYTHYQAGGWYVRCKMTEGTKVEPSASNAGLGTGQ